MTYNIKKNIKTFRISSRIFENQPNEICRHLSEKASKGRFLGPEKLQNHTNENEFSWDDVTDKFSTPASLINAEFSEFHFYISHNTPRLPPPPPQKK